MFVVLSLLVLSCTINFDAIKNDVCNQPQGVGKGRAYIIRWYFDGTECKTFVFGGGSPSTGNNFKSKEACETECGKMA